jgi:elongation factor 1-delta
MAHPYLSEFSETIWFDKWRVDDAERVYQEKLAGTGGATQSKGGQSSLVNEIARARQQIQNSLKSDNQSSQGGNDEIAQLRQENEELRRITNDLRQMMKNLENRIVALESAAKSAGGAPKGAPAPKVIEKDNKDEDEDEDDFELFGSDDENDAEAEKIKEERLKAYAEKKAKKAPLIAKSSILLDVKPWDDETDMAAMERAVRSIEMDGLVWGAAKLVPLAYGIKKLQIMCVVEDDKVSTDDLEDKICAFEDFVQSMDIAAFNKI